MTYFVLVHGSGQNATCWSRVASALRARGHEVRTPDLEKRASDWKIEDHAARIADEIVAPDAVVVAHSLCGIFLPVIARLRDCRLLVYLAAVIPEPGMSVREQFAADPTMFAPEWIAAGARWFDPTQRDSLAREFLFHDCEPPALPSALGSVEAIQSQGLVVQPAPFTARPDTPAVAIVATQDRTLSPDWCRSACRRFLRREPVEIDTGHCPQNSRPDELAALLAHLAAAAPAT